ncbi:MAG: hypothetical protein V2B19_04125 [Pseudomonadota bacterium]
MRHGQGTPILHRFNRFSYRTITNMVGRRVLIPETISKALRTSPPPTTLVYMLAPAKLGGLMFRLRDEDKNFFIQASTRFP